jgi:hypothetical protein
MASLVPSERPEAHDLDALRAQVYELQTQLDRRAADVDRAQSDLAVFRLHYRREVGTLYEELEELERVSPRRLDAERQKRQLTWSGMVRHISGPFAGRGSRPLALSTVTSLRTKRVAEGDGVLQMLRWLDRAPESFVPGADAEECVPGAPHAGDSP